MNDEGEHMLDALLREQFDGPVPDDGFCDRLMERLPVRRRTGWPLLAGTVAGTTMCWIGLWSSPIADAGWRDWLAGNLTAPSAALLIAMASMAILALAWAIAEADDRPDPISRRVGG